MIYEVDFTTPLMDCNSRSSSGIIIKRCMPYLIYLAICPLYSSLQSMGVWLWPQNPSQHSTPGRYNQPATETEFQMKLICYSLWRATACSFPKGSNKLRLPGEKVICQRSYSKTMGELELLRMQTQPLLPTTREETHMTWDIREHGHSTDLTTLERPPACIQLYGSEDLIKIQQSSEEGNCVWTSRS